MMKEKEVKKKKKVKVGDFLFGDVLTTEMFTRNYKLVFLLAFFALIYVGNRISIEDQQIKIRNLKKQLVDIRYKVLTTNSEIMSKSRQSSIENYINSEGSEIKTASTPPYVIK